MEPDPWREPFEKFVETHTKPVELARALSSDSALQKVIEAGLHAYLLENAKLPSAEVLLSRLLNFLNRLPPRYVDNPNELYQNIDIVQNHSHFLELANKIHFHMVKAEAQVKDADTDEDASMGYDSSDSGYSDSCDSQAVRKLRIVTPSPKAFLRLRPSPQTLLPHGFMKEDDTLWQRYTTIKFPPSDVQSLQTAVFNVADKVYRVVKYLLREVQTKQVQQFLSDLAQPKPTVAKPLTRKNDEKQYPAMQPTLTESSDVDYKALLSQIRPLKAAKLFEEDEKYAGRWKIFVGEQANEHLSQIDDRAVLKDVVKRVFTNLSKGQFFGDNCTGLCEGHIPLRLAKVNGDLSILYQIDLQHTADIDFQVVRVWSVEENISLDEALLPILSGSGRSSRYRERCNARSEITNGAYTPLAWHDRLNHNELQNDYSTQNLNEAQRCQLQQIMATNKLFQFSPALLKSILTGQTTESVAQIFMPSPTEQAIVDHDSATFVVGRAGSGKTTTLLLKMLGICLAHAQSNSDESPPRQLCVTKSGELAARIKEYFMKLKRLTDIDGMDDETFKTLRDHAEAAIANKGIDDLEAEEDSQVELPPKWSLLEDKHFPLFISCDHLCALLEADFSMENKFDRSSKLFRDNGNFIDYATFKNVYWDHFDARLKKGLDAAQCFSEFVGNIQGSIESLEDGDGCISKAAYMKQSSRVGGAILQNRDRIYDLFLAYRKQKAMKGHWDAADRSHALLKNLKNVPADQQLPVVHAIYVDEIQDNLLVDTEIFKMLCPTPQNHLMAGDTAQTVSASSFRFDDLKASWYIAEMNDELVAKGKRSPVQPTMFHLRTNYRSHKGITNLAQSLINLLSEYFPYSIDDLGTEKGVVEGPLPAFISSSIERDEKLKSLISPNTGESLDFGAHQAVLVRDEATRQRFLAKFGEDFALIFTFYEAKGLEFSDVFIYGFFETSPASNEWRLMLAHAKDLQIAKPQFDPLKHAVLQQEIKLLYVAVTRARNNCWLYDDEKSAESIIMMWNSHNLIRHFKTDVDMPPFGHGSSAEAWRTIAVKLFNKKLYVQAANAFSRAGKDLQASISLAYEERSRIQALNKQSSASDKIVQDYLSLADQFEYFASQAVTSQASTLLIRAAECSLEAKDDERASILYNKAADACELSGRFTQAAICARKAGNFDLAIKIVQERGSKVETSTARSITTAAQTYYLDRKETTKFAKLFNDAKDMVDFVNDNVETEHSAVVLEELGQYSEAAKSYEKVQCWDKVAALSATTNDHLPAAKAHIALVRQSVVLGCDRAALKTKVLNHLKEATRSLRFVDDGDSAPLLKLCEQYRLLFETDRYQAYSKWQELEHEGLQLFMLDFALSGQFVIAKAEDLNLFALAFDQFAKLLQPIVLKRQVDEVFYDVLGFRACESHTDVIIASNSPLYEDPTQESVDEMKKGKSEVYLPLRQWLSKRLHKALSQESQDAANCVLLHSQCPRFLLEGICRSEKDGCDYTHYRDYSEAYFLTRIAALLSQLAIASHCHWLRISLQNYKEELFACREVPRFWINELAQALQPLTDRLGSKRVLVISKCRIAHVNALKEMLRMELNEIHFMHRRTAAQWRLLNNAAALASLFVAELPEVFPLLNICSAKVDHSLPFVKERPIAQTIFGALMGLRDHFSTDSAWENLLYVEHLLDSNLRIELGHLFGSILEPLVSTLILAKKRLGFSRLDNILLPYQMLRELLRRNRRRELPAINNGELHVDFLRRLIGVIVKLAGSIIGRTRNMFFEDKPLTHIEQKQYGFAFFALKGTDFPVTSYFAYRALRLVTLIGMNIHAKTAQAGPGRNSSEDALRDYIVARFNDLAATLKFSKIPAHAFYRSFLESSKWAEVSLAMRSPKEVGTADRLVQLRITRNPIPATIQMRYTSQHIELVQAADASGIYGKILPGEVADSDPKHTTAFVEVDKSNDADTTLLVEQLEPDLKDVSTTFTPQQLEAGRVILRWYRKFSPIRLARLKERESLFFIKQGPYRNLIHSAQISRPYALILRSAVVYLDIALGAVVESLDSVDLALRKARRAAVHSEIEKIAETRRYLAKLRNQARDVLKIIAPHSRVHALNSRARLADAILRVGIKRAFFLQARSFCVKTGNSIDLSKIAHVSDAGWWDLGWETILN